MSADIKTLRTRIKSVDSTLHLTKAMGLVASSKIRRATDAMLKSRQYAKALDDTVAQLSAYEECRKSPYMAKRDGNRLLLLVVAMLYSPLYLCCYNLKQLNLNKQ